VVTGYGFLAMEGIELDKVELALISQEAENRYIGVNCGIMDQFAVAMGKANHAIMLQCDTLKYEHVPFESQGYKIVIANTNKRRGLVDSAYNERRSQCEQAVQDLRNVYPHIKLLGEIGAEQFHQSSTAITSDIVRRRAQHVIEENDRVLQSVQALVNKDLISFGQLMIRSHESLRDLYEVSCKELDIMVEAALKVDGVLGSRMTGAGFGGCTVSLVKSSSVDRLILEAGKEYTNETGLTAEFYVAEIGDGVKEIFD
jgi:galactokinase